MEVAFVARQQCPSLSSALRSTWNLELLKKENVELEKPYRVISDVSSHSECTSCFAAS